MLSWFNARKLWILIIFPIFSVKGSDYRIRFWYMKKDDAISIMKSSNLIEKSESSWKWLKKTTYYQRNKETILNRAKEYYENKNEELKKKARNK